MATSLRFHTIFTSVPGIYSYTDKSGLTPKSSLATGVISLVGDAVGGGAGGGTAILELNNSQAARDAYRSGPLLEMALLAFDPSGDTRVGGARKILAVKTNPATQGSLVMSNADGPALALTSDDYGAFANQINVQKGSTGVAPAEEVDFTAVLGEVTEVFDEIGGLGWFSLLYNSSGTDGYATATASIGTDASGNPDKVTAAGTKAFTGEATTTVFTAGDRAVTASNAANDGNTLRIYGVNSDGVPDSEDITLAAAGVTGTKRWQRITGAWNVSAATAVANTTVSDEHANVALTLAFATADVSKGVYSETLTTLGNLVVADRPVALAASGATTDPVVLRGLDRSGAAQVESVTLAGAATVNSTKAWSKITQIEVGAVSSARTATLTVTALDARITTTTTTATTKAMAGTQIAEFVDGHRARIVSGAAGDTGIAVTLYGLDQVGVYQTEVVTTDAVAGTTPVLGTKLWSVIFYAVAASYPAGVISITDETPTTVQSIPIGKKTTGLLAGPTTGYHALNLPVAATTVTVVGSGATVRRVLIVGLDAANAVQREVVTLTGAVAVATVGSWNRIDGIYTGDVEAARTVTIAWSYYLTGDVTNLQQLADFANARDGFTAAVISTAPTTDLISELDIPSVAVHPPGQPLNVRNLTVTFYAKLTELIRVINEKSDLVTATRPDGATGVPTDTVAPVYLSGGSEGVTAYAHYLAALTKLKTTSEPKTIVPLTSDAAVHALLDTHLGERETLRREADGKVGLAANQTKAQVKAAALALNTYHIEVCPDEIQRYDSTGILTWFPPYAAAVQAAGMQAGNASPGEPLTHKWVKANGVRHHASWDSVVDADEMIRAGVLFIEEVTGQGFRWVRGVTSWLKDNNLANSEASVNFALINFVVYLRDYAEPIVGAVNFAGTQNAYRAVIRDGCAQAVEDGLITEYGTINLEAEADQIRLDLEVVPPLPFNFGTINVHAVLALS